MRSETSRIENKFKIVSESGMKLALEILFDFFPFLPRLAKQIEVFFLLYFSTSTFCLIV